jgi:hypothetical protein
MVGIMNLESRASVKLLPVEQDGKWGYKNTDGEWVISPRFILANEFTPEGIAAVVDDDGWLYIDVSGNELIRPFVVDNGPDYFQEGFARFVRDGKFGFFDKTGQIVIEPKFDFAQPFSEGLAAVCMDCQKKTENEYSYFHGGKWGYINKEGELVIPLEFEAVNSFDNGKARVKIDNQWKYLDKNGELLSDVEGVEMPFQPPEQKVLDVDGTDLTGEYILAHTADFYACLKEIFLRNAQSILTGEETLAHKAELENALRCYDDFFESVKGTTNFRREDLERDFWAEIERQKRFYVSLDMLSDKFSKHDIAFDILDAGYYFPETLWDTGLTAGCQIRIDHQILYAYPLVPATTDAYMIPRAAPVAAELIALNEDYMVFLPSETQKVDEKLLNSARLIFGTSENVTDQMENVHFARLYNNFLAISIINDVSYAELDNLKEKYNVIAILKGDPHNFKAVIYIGD